MNRPESIKKLLSASLREEMKSTGISRKLQGNEIEHKVKLVCPAGYDFCSIVHNVHSLTLWNILGHPEYQVQVGAVARYNVLWWSERGPEPNIPLSTEAETLAAPTKLQELVREAVVPVIVAAQTPKGFVEFAISHQHILGRGPDGCTGEPLTWAGQSLYLGVALAPRSALNEVTLRDASVVAIHSSSCTHTLHSHLAICEPDAHRQRHSK